MKHTKRVLALLLSMVMILSLSLTALAGDNDTGYSVSIYVQEAIRDTDGSVSSTYVYTDSPIVVTVTSGQTLKDAVNAACTQTGSVITTPVWKTDDPHYLISLTVDGTAYDNMDEFTYDSPEEGMATYEGLSWMYFDGTPDDMPASSYSYPEVSLGNRVVSADMSITLSYEYLIYIWNY